MAIIEGVVYKKFMTFKVFGVYLSEFLIFLHEIFFCSKILPSSCEKHQILIIGALVTLGTRLKVPILAIFDDFGHFSSCLFWHKPLA